MIAGQRYVLILQGLGVTLLIAFCAIIIGTILGCILALMKISDNRILKGIGTLYTTVLRGLPLATQLMIFYFVVFAPLHLPKLLVAILAYGLNSGAYCTEIFRAGIQGVDIGQTEAARSLGLSKVQTMKEIVLPQAVKNILPALGNEFIMVTKDTSLASTFFIGDLMTQCLLIKGTTYLTMEPLIMVAVVYFVVTFILTKLLAVFERRLRRGDIR
jgi:His/Glu/Gln/Arg/opine family amino acid ABC transporter permease subunit